MKPKVFIGSSSEGLEVAQAIELRLRNDNEVTVWDEGVFAISETTLDALVNRLNYFDFAIFVLTPDDVVKRRRAKIKSARDNVLFELGLFMGPLGRDRTFVVVDPNHVTIPTDLLGVTFATYDSERQDRNLQAAVNPACTVIRQGIRRRGLRWAGGTSVHLDDAGGVAAYYERYPTAEMVESIRRATEEIRIIQTWISNWNDICQAIGDALGVNADAIRKSKTRARIILIDPASPLCEARGVHSGQKPGATESLAKTTLEQMLHFKRQHALSDNRMDVRLSGELPTFAMFASDDIVYFNPYLRDRNTYQSPCFRFTRTSAGFARELGSHFENQWRATIPSEAAKRRSSASKRR